MIKVPTQNSIPHTGALALSTGTAGNAYTIQPMRELMHYLHATAKFPPLTTFKDAIAQDTYHTWPGLNQQHVTAFMRPSPYTAMGHLHMIRQGIRSTKHTVKQQPNGAKSKTHRVNVLTLNTGDLKHIIASDPPGHYPVTSARGHKNIFLMEDYDSNYIHAVPIKLWKAEALVKGFHVCYTTLANNGFDATIVRLDNEVSTLLIEYIKSRKLQYQLASP